MQQALEKAIKLNWKCVQITQNAYATHGAAYRDATVGAGLFPARRLIISDGRMDRSYDAG